MRIGAAAWRDTPAVRVLVIWIAALLVTGAATAMGRDGGPDVQRAVAGGTLPVTVPSPITLPSITVPMLPVTVPSLSVPPVTIPRVRIPPVTIPPVVQGLIQTVAGTGGDPMHIDRTGLWLVDTDQGTARVLLQDLYPGSASFSPDGRRAVVVTYPHPGMNGGDARTTWVVDLATGLRRSILPIEPGIGTVSWSLDGTWIAYTRVPMVPGPIDEDPSAPPGPHGVSEVWLVHPDGSGRHRLAIVDGFGGRLTWSPDGRQLVAALYNDGRLLVADVSKGTERRLPAAQPYIADWSPDGRQLVTASDHGATTMVDVTSGASRVLLDSAWFPRWSPSGDWIAVYRPDDRATHLVRPDGTLGLTSGTGQPVDWSSDGRRLEMVDGTHASDVLDLTSGVTRTVAQSRGPGGPELIPTVWVPRTHTVAVIASPSAAYYLP